MICRSSTPQVVSDAPSRPHACAQQKNAAVVAAHDVRQQMRAVRGAGAALPRCPTAVRVPIAVPT
jgi:hypothetical protein